MTKTFSNAFADAMAAGKTLVGGWSLSGSATVVEAMGHIGYDYLVIDLEHSPSSIHDVRMLLMAADASGVIPVVRMADQNATSIKHALDLGANTLMFPFVETAEEAAALVKACHYPPMGTRGFCRMNRASRYLSDADYPARSVEDTFIIAQLETPEAIARSSEIGSVDGINGLFVGPGDLSVAIGKPGQIDHEKVTSLMLECAEACAKIGKPLGTVMPSPTVAAMFMKKGYSFVSIGNDMAAIVATGKAALTVLAEARSN